MIGPANTATLLSTAGYSTSPLAAIGLSAKPGSMSMDQINKVSKDFESMFIGQMVEQMFGDSQGEEAFGNKETSDIYKGMMADEYGKQISRAGGIGIADYVKQELMKLQEK